MRRTLLAFTAILVLAGCRTEVYGDLSQRESNEMTALLLRAGIDAERVRQNDDDYSVVVADADFAQSVTLIEASGLPKPRFVSLAEVFDDDRLIASPLEERARLNYALSQELSRTVSEIDGIVSARVHLATPTSDPAGRRDSAPAAAVALHYRDGLETDETVGKIKVLIANAVDGLVGSRVSVALFPTEPTPDVAEALAGPAMAHSAAAARLGPAKIAVLAGGLLVLLLSGFALIRRDVEVGGQNPS